MDSLLEAVTMVLSQSGSDVECTQSRVINARLNSDSTDSSSSSDVSIHPNARRACHRCGNLRSNMRYCSQPMCPHVYCVRCVTRAVELYGSTMFDQGCPVCKKLCCCGNKTLMCASLFHCYRKCPVSRAETQKKIHQNASFQKSFFCPKDEGEEETYCPESV